MGGIFGGTANASIEKAEAAAQYDDMVTKALLRLTRWAFPDSQVERRDALTWQLWHLTDQGEKYIDVAVTLQFKKGKPSAFFCSDSLDPQLVDELTREALDDALRQCICSTSD